MRLGVFCCHVLPCNNMDFIWEKCETAIRGLLEENSLRWLVIEASFGCLQWLSALDCFWKPGYFYGWAKSGDYRKFVCPKLYSCLALNMFMFDSSTVSLQLTAYHLAIRRTPTDITDIIQLMLQLAFVLFLLVALQIQLTSLWKSQVIDDLSMKSWFSIAMLIYQGVYCCIYTPMFLGCCFTLMHYIPISSSTEDVSWYGFSWLDTEFKSGFCRWCFL